MMANKCSDAKQSRTSCTKMNLKNTNMKTISKLAWVATLSVLGTASNAQLNNFYHTDVSGSADHGRGDKVVTAVSSEDYGDRSYVVASATRNSLEKGRPSVSLSRYELDGTPIYHRTFVLNKADGGDFTSVKGLVELTKPAATGFGVLAYTNTAPAQSVVIRTSEKGNMIWKRSVGANEAASLAYDNDRDRLLVLTSRGDDNADLQLVVLDGKSGAVIYTRHIDGFHGSKDAPARVLYDGLTQDYLLVGTSTYTTAGAPQSRLLLSRLGHDGKLVYTHLIGDDATLLTAVDATIIPSGPDSRIVIGGSVTALVEKVAYNNQPAYTSIRIDKGDDARIHIIQKQFDLKALTYRSGDLDIVGNKNLAGKGIQANLFSIDPANPKLVGSDHVYNKEPSTFAFNDVAHGTDKHLVMIGYHQYPVLWDGSPGNLNYPWLTTADAEGNGACESADEVSVVRARVPHFGTSNMDVAFESEEVAVREESQAEKFLNGCDLDFREAAPTVSSSTPATFRLYPNPTSDLINIEYTSSDNDNVVLNIIDMAGRVVLSQKMMSGEHITNSLSVANLASGVYYTDLRVNDQSIYKVKVAVQH